jgi:hypothetical protein
MTLMSRLAAWLSRLPPAETYDVGVEKNIQIPMPDGVALRAGSLCSTSSWTEADTADAVALHQSRT